MKSKAKLLELCKYKSIIYSKIFLYFFLQTSSGAREWVPDPPPGWAKDVQIGAAKITALDVICGKEHMTVRAEFSAPFQGIITSKGTYGQQNCVYVKPFSSITHATFNVKYDQCGTKPDLQGKYYENTIVIQYGTDIIEAWDEAKRLRCEWFEAYEKPATFRPAIPVADLDVIEMNFQGDEIDCWMTIQEGKGPWAREVSRIVAVGQPMTIVIAINDYKNNFDMRVKSCFAHDGVKPAIHLTDEYGCVLRPKMLSPFKKISDTKGKASLISYAQFLAFKFPDTMDVQIQCTVEVCRHGCADVCEVGGSEQSKNPSMKVSAEIHHSSQDQSMANEDIVPLEDERQPIYQDLVAPHKSILPPIHFTNDEPFNIDVKGSEEVHPEAHIHHPHQDYEPVPPNQNIQINSNSESYQEGMIGQESDNQPVYKAPAIHFKEKDLDQNQRFKIPNLSSLNIANLKPEDLEVANKLLSNNGLNKGNIDFSQLAATFAHGLQPKDILSLMQRNNVKDLVSKFTNRIEEQPIAEALHSIHLSPDRSENVSSISLTTDQINFNLEQSEPTQATPFLVENTISAEGDEVVTPVLYQPQYNNIYNNLPFNGNQNFGHLRNNNQFNKKISINSNEKSPPVGTQVKAPIAQVLNVPLQPGLPFLQISPNEIFKQQFIRPQKFGHSSQGGKIGFPMPSHPIPVLHSNIQQIVRNVMGSTNNFGPEIHNIRVKSNGGPDSQFPFGPRSLRLRRSDSTPKEIGLKKGFQVVTSVDLAFFPNISTDSAPIYSGRKDNRANGVCLSVAQLATALSCILWLIVVAFSSCAFMIYKLDKHKKSNTYN